MTESVHTLIARAPSAVIANAAAAMATTVANAADTGKLLVQVNGVPYVGSTIPSGSSVKISVAKREDNGSISIVSTPEFNPAHIYDHEFFAPAAAVDLAVSVDFGDVIEGTQITMLFLYQALPMQRSPNALTSLLR
jgi:hypothetical protein